VRSRRGIHTTVGSDSSDTSCWYQIPNPSPPPDVDEEKNPSAKIPSGETNLSVLDSVAANGKLVVVVVVFFFASATSGTTVATSRTISQASTST